MTRAALTILAALALSVIGSPSRAADPTGLWWAEGGSAQVEVLPCDGALCARVVWLRFPLDEFGCQLRDEENPDPTLRSREMIGIQLMEGLRASPDDANEWSGGHIYDPTSGRTYQAVVEFDELGRLRVRGYLGIRLLGRTAIWNRVRGAGDEASAQCLDPIAAKSQARAELLER